MIGALFFLVFQSWKNRTLKRIRRLKQPKYLVGAIFGACYFYLYFYRWLLRPRGFDPRNGLPPSLGASGDNLFLLESLGALVLFVIVVMAWVFPHERAALTFTEAEVAFLFPAPVSRRTLIHYKLLKSQIAILFSTVIFTLIFRRLGAGGTAWIRMFGWWVILSTLNLHFLGSSFARTILLEHGISNWKRRIIVLTLVGGLVTWVSLWVWKTLPPPPDLSGMKDGDDFFRVMRYYAHSLTEFGPVPYLLYPFRLVVRPYVSRDALAFVQALWPALLVMAAHYVWVVRSNVAFEEASVEASRKFAERVAAMRASRQHGIAPKKKKRAPFKLSPTGQPAVAMLWKNLIGAGQGFTLRFWLIMIWIIVAVGIGLGNGAGARGIPVILATVGAGILGMSFLMGPQIVRQDFRRDLPMTDILKTYPLAGWQMALGELLAPAVILTALQWCLILLLVLISPQFGQAALSLPERIAYGFSLAVVGPMLNLVSLVIPNAAVLMFPGWLQSGKDAPTGIEATGTRLIFMIGQLLALVVSLVPSAILVTLAILGGKWLTLPLPMTIPLAAVGAALIMAVEAGFGLMLLGKLFERFDVATDGAAN